MTQFNKTSSRRKSAKKPPNSEAADTERKGRLRGLIIALLIMAVIGVVAGVGYYLIYVLPFQHTLIVVDDMSINMRYFLKRVQIVGGDPWVTLTNLTNELIIKKVAPQPPYNIKVTPEDIDEVLRNIARGESETISDSEFREWYRQQLNENELSDSEFRDLMYTGLLAAQLQEYLAARVPTVAEQVYVHVIFVDSYADGEAVRARWEAGEDFADLAREASIDVVSAANGGDIGWFPYDILDDTFKYTALSLDVGEVSQPVSIGGQEETGETTWILIMVSEKAAAREVDEDALAMLKSKALEEWLSSEMSLHTVEFHGFKRQKEGAVITPGFDNYTYYWIMQQLAKKES